MAVATAVVAAAVGPGRPWQHHGTCVLVVLAEKAVAAHCLAADKPMEEVAENLLRDSSLKWASVRLLVAMSALAWTHARLENWWVHPLPSAPYRPVS